MIFAQSTPAANIENVISALKLMCVSTKTWDAVIQHYLDLCYLNEEQILEHAGKFAAEISDNMAREILDELIGGGFVSSAQQFKRIRRNHQGTLVTFSETEFRKLVNAVIAKQKSDELETLIYELAILNMDNNKTAGQFAKELDAEFSTEDDPTCILQRINNAIKGVGQRQTYADRPLSLF